MRSKDIFDIYSESLVHSFKRIKMGRAGLSQVPITCLKMYFKASVRCFIDKILKCLTIQPSNYPETK